MLRYSGLKIQIRHTEEDLKRALTKKLRLKHIKLIHFRIIKKSLDARDKHFIHWNYILDFTTDNDAAVLKACKGRKELSQPPSEEYRLPQPGRTPYEPGRYGRIIVAGSGPAGLFCAYFLAENGFCPLLVERGEAVSDRLKTVRAFWEGRAPLNPDSNIQFGEGGAGTFSDGKLTTGVKDPKGRNRLVLSTFVKNGAPEEILYESRPHIGSDLLMKIVQNMREKILENGGEVSFNTKLTGLEYDGTRLQNVLLTDLKTNQTRRFHCENLVLAIGHSARDTFTYLNTETPLEMTAKPFAVGIRIQHLQETINRAQYGPDYRNKYRDALPPADYKLVRHTEDGHAVYSFCMCPGGYVVNSSSEPGRLCINGMSYSARAGKNANAAIVIGVKPSDDPLGNIAFQRSLEENAFVKGGGLIPVQRFGDFEEGLITKDFGSVKPEMKGGYAFADLNEILDAETCRILKDSLHEFAGKIKGFDDPDALLSAVEARTSSPVRILRNEHLEAALKGVYPCGEGAGYAGGITSAAMDGIRVFEEIYKKYFVYSDEYL